MADGTTKSGYIGFPIGGSLITFKNSETDAKETPINADAVYSLTINSAKGDWLFVRSQHRRFVSKKSIKTVGEKSWFLVLDTCNGLVLYKSADVINITNSNELLVSVAGQTTTAAYLLKNKTDDTPIIISEDYGEITANNEKTRFRKFSSAYLKDQPELVERIQNKEFRGNILTLFNAACE